MARTFSNLFGLIKEKAVPKIDPIVEQTREGISKAYIPRFLYKPPFGYPRFVDLPNIRRLAAMPYVDMCITTIIDEMSAVKWEVLPIEGKETGATEKHLEHVKSFFMNPNTNKESFETIRRKYLRDVLEVDAGVINKIFNIKGEMVEIVARDGVTFTKNPDLYGMMTDREDILIDSTIVEKRKETDLREDGFITSADAREKAAYFQYGWITGAKPVPFGKREIVWMELHPRTDTIYGRSPVENLATTIQTLIYAIEHNLEYFNDNSIPKGVLGFEGLDMAGLKSFREQWREQQRKKDTAGNWKKDFHNLPIMGAIPKFERLQFTNSELELLEGQKWWSKLVWACFGVTSVELGYSEDAKGLANQIVQSNIFKKRAIYPLLRLEEYSLNKEIISEFEYDDVEIKFSTYDVDEETKKAALYDIQLKAGYRSINEIRVEEGLEEVEWGEKQSAEEAMEMQQKFAPEQGGFEKGSIKKEEADEKKKVQKEKDNNIKEKKDAEIKNFQDNPLILRENEAMSETKLEKSIVYLLKQNEKKIKNLIEKEVGENKLKEVKDLSGLAKALKALLAFGGLKGVSDAVIKKSFEKGWENSEKQLNKNLVMNSGAITFIQDYTFNNIRGMTEEIMQDLRQELERGIMGGEGIAKIKARVEKVFNVGENRAEMIARTESNRAENQGRLQAFKTSGERYEKVWVTHKDDRTSPICGRLDGQKVKMDENFKDSSSGWEGPVPPSHVNCRSSAIFILKESKEQELKAKEDAAEEMTDKQIDVALKEKDAQIKDRKNKLLKNLEDDHERNQNIPGSK